MKNLKRRMMLLAVLVIGLLVISGCAKVESDIKPKSRFCSDNPKLDFESRIQDENVESSATMLSTVYYLHDKTEGTVTEQTLTASGTSYVSLTDVIKCGHEVDVYIKSDQDQENGRLIATLKPSQTREDPIRLDGKGSAYGGLHCRVKDLTEDNYIYDSASATKTTYRALAATAINWTSTTDNVTGMTLGATDVFDVRLECKTSSADKEFGETTMLCLDVLDDSNSNDWDEPEVSVSGKTLTEMKGNLNDEDKQALAAYEYCYELAKPIGDTKVSINVEISPGDGVNPDKDVAFKFLAKGVYHSINDPNKLIWSYFRDDSGNTEIATATAQLGKFSIY